MSDEKILPDLSALLDGETHHPEAVRERLMNDPAFAARYETYEAMGDALRELATPAVAADFVDRVMTRCAEVAPLPGRPGRSHRRLGWGVAAALALVAAGGLFYSLSTTGLRETSLARAPAPSVSTFPAWDVISRQSPTDEEDLWTDEAWPALEGEQIALIVADLLPPTEEFATAEGDADLFEVMDMMEDVDAEVLEDLLKDYLWEGHTS